MSYTMPFQLRAPDFRRVAYEYTYETEGAAEAAFRSLYDKRYRLQGQTFVLSLGHRMHSRDEAVDGRVLSFTAQLRGADLAAGSPGLLALEAEVAGGSGAMTSKEVLA